jgi:hypothetical protein
MIDLILFAAAAAHPAIDAERAFALMAQQQGQWAAFRAYATADAVMFDPAVVNAQTWLADRPEPRVAVQWWPSASFVSCDGKVAVNTGSWVRSGRASTGYFTTVWTEQADKSWKWVLDAGAPLDRPRAASDPVKIRRAACRNAPEPSAGQALIVGRGQWGAGLSPDRSLIWKYEVDEAKARTVRVWLWNGRAYAPVLEDRASAQ